MRSEIEKRLHRVKIDDSSLNRIRCNYASICDKAQNCKRCNDFFLKCSEYKTFNLKTSNLNNEERL